MPVSFRFSRKAILLLSCIAVFAISGCGGKKSRSVGGNYRTKPSSGDMSFGSSALPGSTGDFTVSVGDRVFFDTDSSSVRADAQDILARQAQWLLRYRSYRILIEGHADERGTREYNLALGARRAAAVRDFLISQGIESIRLKTISYGKEKPVAVCDDISCWNQNRRAVTVLDSARN